MAKRAGTWIPTTSEAPHWTQRVSINHVQQQQQQQQRPWQQQQQQQATEDLLLMVSPAYRAHQQMRIHIGHISADKSLLLAQVMRRADLYGSGKSARGCISSDKRAPAVLLLTAQHAAMQGAALLYSVQLQHVLYSNARSSW
jgi:hypothetical protein